MLDGKMTLHDGDDGEKTVGPHWYAARNAGIMHGPVRGETGCLIINFCWYDTEDEE
jgi:hypothetical protein